MAQDSESRALDKVIVRLPDGMRDRLKAQAEANKRSMNAEIVARLAVTLDADERRNYEFNFDEVVAAAARQAATAATIQVINTVLCGLDAPDGTSASDRLQMMLRDAPGIRKTSDPA